MKVSKIALAAALTVGASGMVVVSAAEAQRAPRGGQSRATQQTEGEAAKAEEGQRQWTLSAEERAALVPLTQAVQAQNWEQVQSLLPAAEAAAQGGDAKYLVGQIKFQLGRQTQNQQMQREAVDLMIASGSAPADNLGALLGSQVAFAINAEDWATAERILRQIVQTNPNDVERLTQLAEVQIRQNNRAEALQNYRRILQLREAAGQQPDENTLKRALALAYEARQAQPAIELSQELVDAYPTPENWRDALLIYRELGGIDGDVNLDVLRLLRATEAMTGERDFLELAGNLNRAGLPGEAEAVIQEGISRGALAPSIPAVADELRTASARVAEDRAALPGLQRQAAAAANGAPARAVADALFGYRQYGEAAEMYRLALQKGGVNADLVNTRLGAALALAGQRAQAEAAFRAVSGPRQALANYWLTWLENRAA